MKVKLLRDARITHKAGEVIEVSPSECFFLTSTGSAVEVKEPTSLPVEKAVVEPAPAVKASTAKKTTTKKDTKK